LKANYLQRTSRVHFKEIGTRLAVFV